MTFFRWLPFALLLATSLHGQDLRSIIVRAICFQYSDNLKEVNYLSPGKNNTLTPIPLWRNEPSDDIHLKVAGGILRFVIPVESEDDKPKFKVVAEGKLGSSNRQMLYFMPGPPDGPPYFLRCFNDDTKGFPMGSSRVINLTKTTALVTMGEHKTAIKPGASTVIPRPRKVNAYSDYNRVIELVTKDGRPYQVANNRGKSSNGKRDLVVIYMNPRTKRPDVNFHRDIPSWTLPKPIPE